MTATHGRPVVEHPAVRALLTGLIDYAGLFPPAGLGMREAVRNFAAYQRRPDHWALGRLVVPAGRLGEFESELSALPEADRLGTRWPLTVLLGADVEDEVGAILDLNERHRHAGPEVLSVEARAPSTPAIATLRSAVPSQLQLFAELPPGPGLATLVRAAKEAGVLAKVRAGSIRPGEIPSIAELAGFLVACRDAELPFKATAGLHHPLRRERPLTYAGDSPRGVMHGYLNLFLAAAELWRGGTREQAEHLLGIADPALVTLEADRLRLGAAVFETALLVRVRREFALGIGSCSFTEPVEEIEHP